MSKSRVGFCSAQLVDTFCHYMEFKEYLPACENIHQRIKIDLAGVIKTSCQSPACLHGVVAHGEGSFSIQNSFLCVLNIKMNTIRSILKFAGNRSKVLAYYSC